MNPVHPRLAAGLAVTLAGATLALTPTTSQAATHAAEEKPQEAPAASVADDGKAPVIGTSADDRYIVVLDKEAPGKSLRAAKAEVRADGATVTHSYSTVLDGFAAELNDKALAALRNNPNVAYIEADAPVQLAATQSPATWGLDRIDQRDLPLNNSLHLRRRPARA